VTRAPRRRRAVRRQPVAVKRIVPLPVGQLHSDDQVPDAGPGLRHRSRVGHREVSAVPGNRAPLTPAPGGTVSWSSAAVQPCAMCGTLNAEACSGSMFGAVGGVHAVMERSACCNRVRICLQHDWPWRRRSACLKQRGPEMHCQDDASHCDNQHPGLAGSGDKWGDGQNVPSGAAGWAANAAAADPAGSAAA